MVEAESVENAVEEEVADLDGEGVFLGGRLAPRLIDGDDDVARPAAAFEGSPYASPAGKVSTSVVEAV